MLNSTYLAALRAMTSDEGCLSDLNLYGGPLSGFAQYSPDGYGSGSAEKIHAHDVNIQSNLDKNNRDSPSSSKIESKLNSNSRRLRVHRASNNDRPAAEAEAKAEAAAGDIDMDRLAAYWAIPEDHGTTHISVVDKVSTY